MKSIDILLIEDNEGDIMLTREALEQSRILVNLNVVRDGKAGMDYLSGIGDYADSVQPDLILLDINLPKKNGHEVLKFIKEDENLKHIPVIMLTTSSFEKDIKLSYQNYVSCYITKPVDGNTFLDVVSKIENFWITIVKLPVKTKT